MRPINLSLNNWPPLASHLCVLVLGIVLANVSTGEDKPAWRVKAGWAVVRIASTQLQSQHVERSYADVVIVAVDEQGAPRCRLLDTQMVQADYDQGPVLLLPINKVGEFSYMLRLSSRIFAGPSLVEKSSEAIASLNACARGGRVRFGAGKA